MCHQERLSGGSLKVALELRPEGGKGVGIAGILGKECSVEEEEQMQRPRGKGVFGWVEE